MHFDTDAVAKAVDEISFLGTQSCSGELVEICGFYSRLNSVKRGLLCELDKSIELNFFFGRFAKIDCSRAVGAVAVVFYPEIDDTKAFGEFCS